MGPYVREREGDVLAMQAMMRWAELRWQGGGVDVVRKPRLSDGGATARVAQTKLDRRRWPGGGATARAAQTKLDRQQWPRQAQVRVSGGVGPTRGAATPCGEAGATRRKKGSGLSNSAYKEIELRFHF